MRKNLTGVLIGLLLFMGLVQSTAAQSKVEYLLNLGVSNPAAPDNFTNGWNRGYTFGFGIDVPLNERISWKSSFDFSSHGLDVSGLRFNTSNVFQGYNMVCQIGRCVNQEYYGLVRFITLSSSLKVKPFMQKNNLPYLLGGFGLVRIRMKDDTLVEYYGLIPIQRIKNETAFVINWGVGYKFLDNGRFGAFIEAIFSNAFTSEKNTLYTQFKTGFSIR